MLDRLCWSDHFESFLANKPPTESKRRPLTGLERTAAAASAKGDSRR